MKIRAELNYNISKNTRITMLWQKQIKVIIHRFDADIILNVDLKITETHVAQQSCS